MQVIFLGRTYGILVQPARNEYTATIFLANRTAPLAKLEGFRSWGAAFGRATKWIYQDGVERDD